MTLQFNVYIVSIFPEIFPGSLEYSIAGKALKDGLWSLKTINIRDFGITKHRKVDDVPFGGGSGMIMRPDVLGRALDYTLSLSGASSKIFYMSPRGRVLTQEIAKEIVSEENIIILCGRFEGIDERVIEKYNITEISIGDYILSGGELAAAVLIDVCVRLIPGVIDNNTLKQESFEKMFEGEDKLLEYPQYTRPYRWLDMEVPNVLLSGHHAEINNWRKDQALRLTKKRRPDLLS